ncbi:MAG TPA: F0F1 ATP synthase subunit B [Armatimonadota bacterium]|nr:F0F1 ATP synthase subunit B [Armatimonadota bacterium]
MSGIMHTLKIDPRVMAAQVTGFILLWILLAKYFFRPVLALLDSRRQEVKSLYESAESERAKAEEFRADYEKRMAGIEAEARARIQAAIKEAQGAKNEILADAKSRAEDILRRGQEDLAREREKTLAQLRGEVVNISVAAAGKLIEESLDQARHRRLVSDFIDRIGTAR